MFASNKTLGSFDCPQKPFGFVGVNCVLEILLMCGQLQVVQMVICAVKIFVVYFQTTFNRAIECFPHKTMHRFFGVFGVAAQINNQVVSAIGSRLDRPKRRVANPYFAALDVAGGSQASLQKLSNFSQQRALFKHALGLGDFKPVQRFAPRRAPHVSMIANFVQIFKAENWFPRFHAKNQFNMNRSIT